MNIITNNCLGGHIYRDVLKTEYQNPFIWCFLEPYFDFIKEYPNINLKNYEIKKIEENSLKRFKLVIDNKYELKFWHYWFDEKSEKPIISDRNVKYNKIWEYIVEKYETRLKRINENDEICFAYYSNELNTAQFSVLKSLSKNHKVLIFNNKFNYNDKNIRCFSIDENWKEPKFVTEKYKMEIKDFLC